MLSLLFRILSTLNTLVNLGILNRKTLGEIQDQQSRDSRTLREIQDQQAKDSATLHEVQITVEHIQDEITPGPAEKIIFTANLDGQITEGVTQMNMTDSQQVGLSIQPVDKKGNPAPVDGAPQWASSNTEVVTVTPATDGMSAVATAVGPLGTATISVTADADLGAGVTEIAGSLDITIMAGAASTVTITAGTPTEQS